MNLDQGDPFEIRHKDWLRSRLPAYEGIWSDFIGHDGFGRPLPIHGLSRDEEKRRTAFYQAHYTMALKCLSIEEAMGRANATLGEIKDDEGLRLEFEFLYSFISSIGHVRDMFKVMDDALKQRGQVSDEFQEYYDLRSHVLHGPQMPYDVASGYLKIPLIARRNKVEGEWDDASDWLAIDPGTFVLAAEFCVDTGTSFFALVNKLHPAIYAGACRFFGGKRVAWTQRPIIQKGR